jgi:hypothetical protein
VRSLEHPDLATLMELVKNCKTIGDFVGTMQDWLPAINAALAAPSIKICERTLADDAGKGSTVPSVRKRNNNKRFREISEIDESADTAPPARRLRVAAPAALDLVFLETISNFIFSYGTPGQRDTTKAFLGYVMPVFAAHREVSGGDRLGVTAPAEALLQLDQHHAGVLQIVEAVAQMPVQMSSLPKAFVCTTMTATMATASAEMP